MRSALRASQIIKAIFSYVQNAQKFQRKQKRKINKPSTSQRKMAKRIITYIPKDVEENEHEEESLDADIENILDSPVDDEH